MGKGYIREKERKREREKEKRGRKAMLPWATPGTPASITILTGEKQSTTWRLALVRDRK